MKGFFKFLLGMLAKKAMEWLLPYVEQRMQDGKKPLTRVWQKCKRKFAAGAIRFIDRKGHWQGKHKGKQLGIEQGIKQGKQLGIEEYKRDIVKHMLARGMPDDQICDLLQLSKRELAAIKRKLKKLG